LLIILFKMCIFLLDFTVKKKKKKLRETFHNYLMNQPI